MKQKWYGSAMYAVPGACKCSKCKTMKYPYSSIISPVNTVLLNNRYQVCN